jgi:hypothetical protein
MIKPPGNVPAEPIPAIARPMIRTMDEGAVAQIKLPISKTMTKARKDHFREKCWKILPARGWNAQLVKRNALPYQPTSPRESN